MDREETGHPISPELLILHFIATGIVRYQEQCVSGPGGLVMVDGSYPESLQRGLDLLNVRRYQKGLPLIKSVEDLLAWCRKPLAEWSLELEGQTWGWELTGAERLLEGSEPSAFCLKLASLPPTGEHRCREALRSHSCWLLGLVERFVGRFLRERGPKLRRC